MLADAWEVARRRRWLIAVPLLVVFVLPTVATLLLHRSYVASGTLQVSPNTVISPIVSAVDQPSGGPYRDAVQVALDDAKLVLGSRSHLTEIAVRAGLSRDLRTDQERTLARITEGSNLVAASPELLRVEFRAESPELAQRVAQAELDTIVAARRTRASRDAARAVALFASQVTTYRTHLRAATAALDRFQRAHPELALSEAQKNLVTQLTVWRAEIAQVRLQLQQGKGDHAVLKEREAVLLRQIDAVAVPLGATPDVQLELLRLTNAQRAAEQSFDNAVAQLESSRLLAKVRNEQASRDVVLDQASLPVRSSHGKALTLATLAFVVAVATATGFVMLAEYLDTKVRRPADLSAGLGVPVLAVLTSRRVAS